MQYSAVLKKMDTEISETVQYYLQVENGFLHMNQMINHTLDIKFVGYQCLCCGLEKKIFRQGFCYDCFFESAQVGDWIMRPELSKAHLDIEDRDLSYEKKAQLQPHIVYLALSSNVKVGVTRKSQIPTRWIDQGASSAIPLVEVPNRYLAGITEVALKKHVSDKTSWQKMLKNELASADLVKEREILLPHIPDEVRNYVANHADDVTRIDYPVEVYPPKIKSLNLEKIPEYKGVLQGIKGQYLIFKDGTVFNVRNNEGYQVSLSIDS